MRQELAAAAIAAVLVVSRASADDLNQRSFEVTVVSEDGVPLQGKATAELVASDATSALATYSLARTVGGTSAPYRQGMASIDAAAGKISVIFKRSAMAAAATRTPGIAHAIDESPGATSTDSTTTPDGDVHIDLALAEGSDANVHLFTARWSADGHTYSEQWRELTNTVKGVDVSKFQLQVDWAAVKRAGIGFAFCRVGDGLGVDPTFARNWAGLRNVGIVRGVYQFFRASKDPIAQADLLVQHVGRLLPGDLPPVLDAEVMDGVSVATFNANMKKWIAEVEAKLGRKPIVYTGSFFWNDLGNPDVGALDLWIAEYPRNVPASGPSPSAAPKLPTAWKTWKFWQYSPKASFPGITQPVDASLFNGNLADLLAYAWTGSTPDEGLPAPQKPTKVTIDHTLKEGMTGVEVTALQVALGLAGSNADGIFGPGTKNAVEAYQRSKGLTVDGIAGPATLQSLGLR